MCRVPAPGNRHFLIRTLTPCHERLQGAAPPAPQSSGSSLTIEAPWLLPTQKVTGVVVLSTNTRRMLVERGSRYSTNCPDLGSSRRMRSVDIEPVHASPFLSSAAS